MPEAFIDDHVQTSRGRGRPDGSLHEVSTLGLDTTVLRALDNPTGFDPHAIDDVVLGCVDAVGEAAIKSYLMPQGVSADLIATKYAIRVTRWTATRSKVRGVRMTLGTTAASATRSCPCATSSVS